MLFLASKALISSECAGGGKICLSGHPIGRTEKQQLCQPLLSHPAAASVDRGQTAGNPPEYNRMVREFDVVTMDRMKLIEVTPEIGAWRAYAGERRLHSAILSYLEIKKEHFYVMEQTAKGRAYVTARGWEDLSEILTLYEDEGMRADTALISQYLHHDTVAKEFAAYYDLYLKYRRDYRIADILSGTASETAIKRAQAAKFT